MMRVLTPAAIVYGGPERRNRPRYVLVFCPMCERWISEETRHPCELDPDVRAARLEARKVKQMETGIRDYD